MQVQISYPLPLNPSLEDRIKMQADHYSGELLGSGAGFGKRDLDFSFGDRYAAIYFLTAILLIETEVKFSLEVVGNAKEA